MRMPSVTAKLGRQRTAQRYGVLPRSDGRIQIQSDKAYGHFDPATGDGHLCIKGNDAMSLALFGTPYGFPAAFVAECVKVCPTPGGSTDLGGIVIMHTVQVVGS